MWVLLLRVLCYTEPATLEHASLFLIHKAMLYSENCKISQNMTNLLLVSAHAQAFHKSRQKTTSQLPVRASLHYAELEPPVWVGQRKCTKSNANVTANVAKLCIGRYTPKTEYGSVSKQGKKHVGGKGTIWGRQCFEKNLGEDMSTKGTTPGPRNLADIAQFF